MNTRTEPGARARKGAFPHSQLAPASEMASAFEIPPAGAYQLDPDESAITFATRHLFGLGAVDGRFRLASGQIHVDSSLSSSWVRLAVSAASFATGNPGRDTAVRSARLLAAARYPDITFVSTALEADGRAWLLRGRLCVRGHEGPADACLRACRWDGSLLRVRATATVDRFAFGITGARGLAARRLDLWFEIAARPAVAPGGPARPGATL
jgi:polyisoprenoid-binding protein YceI